MRAVHASGARTAALMTPMPRPRGGGWRRPARRPRLADHAGRGDLLDRAEHQHAQLERVDAEVEERAAALERVEQPVLGIDRHPEPEVGIDLQRRADAAARQHVDQRPVRREVAAPDRLHEEAAVGVGRRDHPLRLGGVEGEGLLAQDVLAGLEASDRIRLVARVRRGHVHRVDVGVLRERPVVVVAPGDVVLVGEGVGSLDGP